MRERASTRRAWSRARQLAAAALLLAALPARARGDAAAGDSTAPVSAAQAADAYKRGDYAQAARSYEELRALAPRSVPLLYNLGNAYYKTGDLGRAVANFERAALLAPRDAELVENLRLAREQCEDRPSAGARGPIARGRDALRALTPDEWSALLMVGYVLLLLVPLAPYYAPRRARLVRRLAAGGAVVLLGSLLGLREWGDALRPGGRATVVVPEASIRSGPGETYLGEFSLHPGSLVRVESRRGDWVKISYSPSLKGWTEAKALEFL